MKNKGITLIALVVTIVILIILAGISIGALTGESGLLGQAKEGKEATEISEEKEIISISAVQAIKESATGNIISDIFKEKLRNNAGEGKTEIIDDEGKIIARFVEKNRYYEVDTEGNVEGPRKLVNDDNTGDLSKNEKADGSEEKPFEINCIEDLVTFSIMVNGGNEELGIESNNFDGKNVILMRTLDFKSIFSYNDYATKFYGDLNADGIIENIKKELTKTQEGCKGFTPIGDSSTGKFFRGKFDGRNNKICNLYQNTGDNDAGLFGYISRAEIKNLGLENLTLKSNKVIGGIVASQVGSSIINSCYVEGKLEFMKAEIVGCIVGSSGTGSSETVENCYSTGILKIGDVVNFAGIVGRANGTPCKIKRCYNIMDINVTREEGTGVGGIAGIGWGYKIEECYHIGNIVNPVNKGGSYGITGSISNVSEVYIKNCYNIGDMTGNAAGGISTGIGVDIFNCYSIGKITRKYMGGTINGMNYGGHIVHCFSRRGDFRTLPTGEISEADLLSYLSEYNNTGYGHRDKAVLGYKCNILNDFEMKTQELVDELNCLITAGSSGENEGVITEGSQSVWKLDTNNINNGYPIFEWQD